MPSVGSIDINKDNFGGIINNSTEAGVGITKGVANESELLGELVVYLLVATLIAAVIGAFLGIIILFLTWSKGLKGKVTM